MGHILYSGADPKKRIASSDDGWYEGARQVGEYVNRKARRTDITAVVAEGAGMGAPACFVPAWAEVQLDRAVLDLGRADKVDVDDKLWRLEHAAALGAMRHEASHADHTKFDPKVLERDFGATRKVIDVVTTLEEPRIEYLALRRHPRDVLYLRATAMEIVGSDFKIGDSTYGASVGAALLLGRVDAGVLTEAQGKGFRDPIVGVLGEDVLMRLRALWQRFFRLWDEDYEGMVQIAREWLEALGEDPDSDEDLAAESLMGMGGEGDEGDEGDGDGEGGLGDVLKAEARNVGTDTDSEVVEKRGDERAKRRAAERATDSKRKGEADKAADKAFKAAGAHGDGPEALMHHVKSRPPTSDERRAARSLASALEKIDYHDRAVSKVSSMVPPGRLRGRMAVQAAAARSMGRTPEVAEWTAKVRKRTDKTPLTVGLAVDLSGSMHAAMEPLASTQWVVSTAGAHIDAKVATVNFGVQAYGVSRPGARPDKVHIFYPGDGHEAFRDAALALDGELNLLDGTGARLLIIASDGVFVRSQHREYAKSFIPLAMRKGVAVMFLDFDGGMSYGSYGAPRVYVGGKSAPEVAAVVGNAVTKELARLDRRV